MTGETATLDVSGFLPQSLSSEVGLACGRKRPLLGCVGCGQHMLTRMLGAGPDTGLAAAAGGQH